MDTQSFTITVTSLDSPLKNTLTVTDCFNQKGNDKLSAKDKIPVIQTSDNDRLETVPHSYTCYRFTDPSIPAKCLIATPELIPDMAIVDPDFADSMPPEVRADSGMDAFTHAIESYVSSKSNDFSRGLSLQAITLIMKYLPSSFLERDPVAREHMHYAATLAGMAFSNSSNGICHSVAGIIGAAYHLTHGRANAIALPYVIRYNSPAVGGLYANVARAIGFKGGNQSEAVTDLIKKVNHLKKSLKVQNSYQQMGIPEDRFQSQLKEFVQRAYRLPATNWNPRKSTMEDLERLFQACYEGKGRLLQRSRK